MNDAKRTWIEISDKSPKNAPAVKTVMDSGRSSVGRRGGTTHIRYELSGLWRVDSPRGMDEYTLFEIPGGGFLYEEGAPHVACEGLFVAIPPHCKVDAIRVVKHSGRPIPLRGRILPTPPLVDEDDEQSIEPSPAIYGSNEPYPQSLAEVVGFVTVSGVPSVHIMVYPLSYRPGDNELTAFTSIDLEVLFSPCENDVEGVGKGGVKLPWATPPLGYRGDDPPPPAATPVLVITVEDFRQVFDEFKTAKAGRYEVEIKTIEEIAGTGRPTPEKIHDFLHKENVPGKWPFVILGGDHSLVPVKMLDDYKNRLFPSDFWYTVPAGGFLPLFCLSRFPVGTLPEITALVRQAIDYPRKHPKSGRRSALLLAGDEQYQKDNKNQVCSAIDSLFQTVKLYDGDKDVTKKKVVEEITSGYGFINYRGHGGKDRWQSYDGEFSSTDVHGLVVGDENRPNVFSLCCLTGDFTTKYCFGTAWVAMRKAMVFIGATGNMKPSVNSPFDLRLWGELVNGDPALNKTVLGSVYVSALVGLYQNWSATSRKYLEDNMRKYVLFGDPTADYMEIIV